MAPAPNLRLKSLLCGGFLVVALTAAAQNIPVGPAATPVRAPALVSPAGTRVDFASDLAEVTALLKAKFDAGQTNADDLAENLDMINKLITRHIKDGNREQVARLYLLDAHIYGDGLKDIFRARAIWGQVVRDFPGTTAAKGATLSLARVAAELAAEPDPGIPEGLELGQKFPDFAVTDLAGNPLSARQHRGHVTMIDFWATWCPPCRAEIPDVVATYNQYHAQGFDIIGVSLDSDQDALATFLPAHGMIWPQYFDGLAWQNKLAVKYGVQSIPTDYLLDTHGIIIGKNLRLNAVPEAVYKALAAP
jgi:thiol-disulfide isomerase/thioredoxin